MRVRVRKRSEGVGDGEGESVSGDARETWWWKETRRAADARPNFSGPKHVTGAPARQAALCSSAVVSCKAVRRLRYVSAVYALGDV